MERYQLPGALGRDAIAGRLVGDRPLIVGAPSVMAQLQPNGFDLTLMSLSRIAGRGTIGVSNDDRMLPELVPLSFDAAGFIALEPGQYQIIYNEIVDLPLDLMALGRPRSSLCRCGVTIHTAVWDAGYRGRSSSLLSVDNPAGFRVQQDARVMQLVFFTLSAAVAAGYNGVYQDENIRAG